jgi:hypothetical protein
MRFHGEASRNPDEATAVIMQHFAGAFVLLETAVAAMIVVGIFAAAAQPWGWASAVQFVLCAGLGLMLWLADSKLNADEFNPAPVAGNAHCRRAVREDA